MEPDKAVKIIKDNFPKTCKMVDGRYQGGFDDHESEFGKALDTALESLERDIEKKPTYKPKTKGQRDFCPNCNAVILPSIRWVYFCDQCGQALKGVPKCYKRKEIGGEKSEL